MTADFLKKGGRYYIAVAGAKLQFPATINVVDANNYTVAFSLVSLAILHKHGCKFSKELLKRKAGVQEKQRYTGELPQFLLPYQVEGCEQMIAKHKGTLLADEQGLGKTVQLLTYIKYREDLRTCVIVCPAHLKWNWEAELKKWYPELSAQVLSSQTPYNIDKDIVIINYEIVYFWVDKLNEYGVKLVVCDEAQRIKSTKTQAYNGVMALGENPVRMMASGTPLVNNPENIWPIVNAVSPYILGGYQGFVKYFCVTRKRPLYRKGKPLMMYGKRVYINQIVASKNLDILNLALKSSVMIRRTKAQVLPQLPSKTRTVIPVELALSKEALTIEKDLQLDADLKDGIDVDHAYAKVYKEIGVKKVDIAKQWIKDFLDSSEESLIVVGWHRDVTQSIYRAFKQESVLMIGGKTDKQESVELFQSRKKRLLVGNYKTIGTGLTLTAASTMLFVEIPLTPADFEQTCDRIHRIGQTNHVNYYILVAKGTIEERIVKMLDAKADAAAGAIDGRTKAIYSIQSLLTDAIKENKHG